MISRLCQTCPVAEGMVCPSVRHPMFCKLAALPNALGEHYREYLRTGATRPKPDRIPAGGIVQLWPAGIVGGAERLQLTIQKATPELPWRGIAIVGTCDCSEFRAEMEALGPVAYGPEAARRMLSRADLVVAWSANDFPGWFRDVAKPPKVVVVAHSTADSDWAVRLFEDDRMVTSYVAVSESARHVIPGRRHKDVTIIPNAVDESRLAVTISREEIRAAWGVKPGQRILGCLNRMTEEKMSEMLPRTIAELPPEWVGVLVGEGFDRGKVEDEAEALCPGRCRFPGQRLDAGNVLNAFDAFLCASRYESFGLSLAEAIRFGVPVVSTPCGIVADRTDMVRIVPHGSDGRAFASAVLADLDDPWETKDRVVWGRGTAGILWGVEVFASSWRGYLAAMLPEKPERSSSARTTKYMTGIPYDGIMPWTPRAELQALHAEARKCPHRGCGKNCTKFECNRYGVEVTRSHCAQCVLDGRVQLIAAT